MKYQIEMADNGWIISWWDEIDDGDAFEHHIIFEIPEDCDESREDPESLTRLLYFVKDDICGQYYSKHKRKNIIIRYEDEDEQLSNP